MHKVCRLVFPFWSLQSTRLAAGNFRVFLPQVCGFCLAHRLQFVFRAYMKIWTWPTMRFSHLGSGGHPWAGVLGSDLPTAQWQASYCGPECSQWEPHLFNPLDTLICLFPHLLLSPSGGPASIFSVSPTDPHSWGGQAPTHCSPIPCWLVQPSQLCPGQRGDLAKILLPSQMHLHFLHLQQRVKIHMSFLNMTAL